MCLGPSDREKFFLAMGTKQAVKRLGKEVISPTVTAADPLSPALHIYTVRASGLYAAPLPSRPYLRAAELFHP